MLRSWGMLGLIAVSGLVGCSSSGQLHKPNELPLVSANELVIERVWKRAESDDELNKVFTQLQSVIIGGVIFNISAQGQLSALALESGKTLWDRQLSHHVSAGLSHNDQYLFVGTPEGEVVALSASNGEQAWKAQLPTEIIVPPVAVADYVIARSVDGSVVALNTESGTEIWRLSRTVPSLTLRGHSSPVISAGKVLIGGADGKMLAVALDSGDIVWESVVASPKGRTDLERLVDVDSSPIVDSGVIYTAAYQGRVVALSLDDGRLLWSRDIGSSSKMVLDDSNLYVIDDASHVWALERRSGATLWKQESLAYRQLSGLVLYDEALMFGDYEGVMHWLSLEDGRMLAYRQIDDRSVVVAPGVFEGVAYVRSRSGKLYALRAFAPLVR